MDRPPLDPGRLRTLLGPRWARVDVVDRTGSTNADLIEGAAALPDRTLLVAEEQTAGRGRLDRTWTSPARAGLHFSVLLRPAAPVATWGWLPLLAGVAVASAVRSSTRVAAALKWPNDVLAADGRKLAGILAQSGSGGVVIGVGLNVTTTTAELPVDTAASLAIAGAVDLDRTALLASVAGALDAWAGRWDVVDGDADESGLADAYRDLCVTIGQPVRVTFPAGEPLAGTAVGVDGVGRLLVRSADEAVAAIAAGDVEHVRPTG